VIISAHLLTTLGSTLQRLEKKPLRPRRCEATRKAPRERRSPDARSSPGRRSENPGGKSTKQKTNTLGRSLRPQTPGVWRAMQRRQRLGCSLGMGKQVSRRCAPRVTLFSSVHISMCAGRWGVCMTCRSSCTDPEMLGRRIPGIPTNCMHKATQQKHITTLASLAKGARTTNATFASPVKKPKKKMREPKKNPVTEKKTGTYVQKRKPGT